MCVCVCTAGKAKAEASGPGVRTSRAGWELGPSDWKAQASQPPIVKGKLGSSGDTPSGPGHVLLGKRVCVKQDSAAMMANKLQLACFQEEKDLVVHIIELSKGT